MPKRIKNSNKGFSLLEVPVALFIIGLILVMYGAASNFVTLNKNAKDQDLAHRIAVSEMEDLRAGGYAAVPASGPFTHSLLSQLPGGIASISTSDYNADTKQVTATVTWKEPASKTNHIVTFTSYINKFGL